MYYKNIKNSIILDTMATEAREQEDFSFPNSLNYSACPPGNGQKLGKMKQVHVTDLASYLLCLIGA